MTTPPQQLTIAQVMERLNKSRSTVARLRNEGLLVPNDTTHGVRYSSADVDAYLAHSTRDQAVIPARATTSRRRRRTT